MGIRPGDSVLMKSFTESGDDWSVSYAKLTGGRKYAFLFLGAGSPEAPLDANLALNAFGWVFDPQRARAIVAESTPPRSIEGEGL